MSSSKPMRPASGTKANKDILGFLNSTSSRPTTTQQYDRNATGVARQDSGFTRASGDLSPMMINNDYATRKGTNNVFNDNDASSSYRGATRQANDYGARKRMPISAADKKDKVIEIERENNTLKEKENFLTQEVKMLTTKLRRVEGLIKQRGRGYDDDSGDYDVSDMQRDLRDECEDLREKNDVIKDRVRKLDVIQRGLTKEQAAGPLHKSGLAKNDKYAHVQGKLEVTHSKVTKRYAQDAKDLRAQIKLNQKKEMELERDLQEAMAKTGVSNGDRTSDQINSEILDMQKQIREIANEYERLEGDFKNNETIFLESKNYVTEVQEQMRAVNQENEKIRQENFKLQLETQQVTDIQREMEDTIEARDNIERSIKNVTAEPFLRKEEGNSLAVRIQDLQQRLQEKDRLARKLKEEENTIVGQYKEHEAILQKLTGEAREVEGSHQMVQNNYKERMESKQGPSEQDAVNGLLKMDAAKYSTLMTDLAMGAPGATGAPIWANLPFLEQVQDRQGEQADPKKQMKNEIDRLRQEKQDFAAELEKAQNLLHLQKDIQRENSVYFNHEEKRLNLVEKSVQAKVEELSRRVDDKSRTLADVERKMTIDLRGSGQAQMRTSLQTDVDVRSEFSAQTHESEVAIDENILDFKIEDAEFDAATIASVPSVALTADEIDRQFITVVTVDFYNHSTETTQMSEGLIANYQTQFSFVNKVDNFYVNFLQKNSIKMDVYVSKNNAAVQVGRAEIFLKELIESEIVSQNFQAKTPIIQRWARIFPVSVAQNASVVNTQMKPLGVIKFKMRLRKPIQQAMRYYREQTEIRNVESFVSRDPKLGSVKPQKKLITISVVGAQSLKTRYADISNVSPFFFYQFYTFDDRYSSNQVGLNPQFNDTYSYEVLVDAKANDYFERESLEIILFDDNAPIAGVALDQASQAENDDMIGVCKVPLATLATGCSMHERYPIRAVDTQNEVGQLEIRIDIMSLESAQSENLFAKSAHDLVYNKQFEDEIVKQIARKLAPLSCEIELMFGIFSQGQRNCTKEDFKHTCLQRLRLERDGLTERELDIFLQSNEYMRDSNVIEKDDFIYVFNGAIAAARNDRLNQISLDQTLARDLGQSQSQRITTQDRTISVSALVEKEIYDLLQQAICMGTQYRIIQEANKFSSNGAMRSGQLLVILNREGGIYDQDAQKVIKYLETDGQVTLYKLDTVFARAKKNLTENSAALQRINRALQQHAKTIIQNMEQQDYNQDGQLNIDGFQAAVRIGEVGMSNQELSEAFYLICGPDQNLAYQDWVLQRYPQFKMHFSLQVTARDQVSTIQRDESATHIDQMSSAHLEQSINERMPMASQTRGPSERGAQGLDANTTHQKYLAAKQKIEKYIMSKDLNIGMMFALIDTNSDSEVSLPEFRRKMRAMHCMLEEDEASAFFRNLDKNNTGNFNFDEFVNEFAAINTELFIQKMKKIFVQAGTDPEVLFDRYCMSDRTKQKMTHAEFLNLIKEIGSTKMVERELYHLKRHFDRGNKGFVSKKDFLHVVQSDFIEQKTFNLGIEDVIKPLASKARKFQLNLGELFDKYDRNRNGRLSVEELREGLNKAGIKIGDEDANMMREYFRAKTRTEQINKTDFIELMNTNFERKFDQQAARKAISDIRKKAEERKLDNTRLQEHFQSFNVTQGELITLADFKRAVHSLKCLDQYATDNLAKFLDAQNEGFISVGNFIAQTNNAVMGSSFRAGSTNKWAR